MSKGSLVGIVAGSLAGICTAEVLHQMGLHRDPKIYGFYSGIFAFTGAAADGLRDYLQGNFYARESMQGSIQEQYIQEEEQPVQETEQ